MCLALLEVSAMPFMLPTFNVAVNVFSRTFPPPIGPARIVGLLANVSLGRRVLTGTDADSALPPIYGFGVDVMLRIMMVPALTDIRSQWQFINDGVKHSDLAEVPAGSGAFYRCLDVADMAKGFPNEHRVVWLCPEDAFPLPIPLP